MLSLSYYWKSLRTWLFKVLNRQMYIGTMTHYTTRNCLDTWPWPLVQHFQSLAQEVTVAHVHISTGLRPLSSELDTLCSMYVFSWTSPQLYYIMKSFDLIKHKTFQKMWAPLSQREQDNSEVTPQVLNWIQVWNIRGQGSTWTWF